MKTLKILSLTALLACASSALAKDPQDIARTIDPTQPIRQGQYTHLYDLSKRLSPQSLYLRGNHDDYFEKVNDPANPLIVISPGVQSDPRIPEANEVVIKDGHIYLQ